MLPMIKTVLVVQYSRTIRRAYLKSDWSTTQVCGSVLVPQFVVTSMHIHHIVVHVYMVVSNKYTASLSSWKTLVTHPYLVWCSLR